MALESFETGNGWLWFDSGIVGWLDGSSQFFGYDIHVIYHMI